MAGNNAPAGGSDPKADRAEYYRRKLAELATQISTAEAENNKARAAFSAVDAKEQGPQVKSSAWSDARSRAYTTELTLKRLRDERDHAQSMAADR